MGKNDLVYPLWLLFKPFNRLLPPSLVLGLVMEALPNYILDHYYCGISIEASLVDGFRHCDHDILRLFQIMQANQAS